MRKTKCKRILSLLLAVLMGLGTFAALPLTSAAAGSASGTASGGTGVTSEELKKMLGAKSYSEYAKYQPGIRLAQMNAGKEMDTIVIDGSTNLFHPYVPSETSTDAADALIRKKMCEFDFSASYPANAIPLDGKAYKISELAGATDVLFTPDSGALSWEFEVTDQGILSSDGRNYLGGYLYAVEIEYYAINMADNVSTVERALSIDGEAPFSEARSLSFSKSWVYGYRNKIEGTVNEYTDPIYGYRLSDSGKEFFADKGDARYFSGKDTFYRYEQDKGGNDLRYTAFQRPNWQTYIATDADGFYQGYFAFYLKTGKHILSLEGTRENLAIKSIRLIPIQYRQISSYDEYVARHAGRVDEAAGTGSVTVMQAEYPTFVSDTSVYPSNDRSSAITQPSTPESQLFNTMGASSFNTVGQWAGYSFRVEKSGWYEINMRYKQNLLDGLFVSRTIKLSGGEYGDTPTVPFMEAYETRFDFSKNWQIQPLNNGDPARPFKFYFEAGTTYTLYLEVGLGTLSSSIQQVQNALQVINDSYLEITKLTGANPDKYRDYGFMKIMPKTIRNLAKQADELDAVIARFKELCGSTGAQVATLEQVSVLIKRMVKKESNIAENLSNLKSYIGTLGTWLNTCKQQGLLYDYITVSSDGIKDERANANFFESAWFEIRSFFVSFFVDYNSMGVKENEETSGTIDVWLAYGRDQSLIWRDLIDTGFTPETNIAVKLKLVAAGTLLPSVLAGQGPEVYIGLPSSDTINYAIRGAIEPVETRKGYTGTYGYDLKLTERGESDYTRMYYIGEDIKEITDKKDPDYINPANLTGETKTYETKDQNGNTVTKTKYRVKDDSIVFNYANTVPISLYGQTFGVPETTNFPMMFYRMDVLANLGVDAPRTWDDLMECIPDFQANNQQVGVTYASALTTLIYQKGGTQWLYDENDYRTDYETGERRSYYDEEYAGAQIGYGTDIALDAFQWVCRLYTDYSFPVTFDAPNRFRTGEMPIIITDYCSMYNTLTVFATEIRGLWSFTQLPGWKNETTGEINSCSVATVTATVMLYGGTEAQKELGWTYMMWQATADAQANYGNRMVALVGPAAKYATANTQALSNLSWTSSELASLKQQFKNLASIPNYPGSYIITRYVQFAFLSAYNDGEDPAEALRSYISTIDKELTRKRQEFDLSTLKPGQTPEQARAEKDAGK